MAYPKILTLLYRFRRLIATFVILVGFFSYYNIFLIDNTLENLRFSLEESAIAYDIEDANGLDIILSEAAVREISPRAMNTFSMGNLEYATKLVNTGIHFKQLDYLKTALTAVIKKKEAARGPVLAMLDRINAPIRKGIIYLAYLPQRLFRPRLAHAQAAGESLRTSFLERIRALEKQGDLRSTVLEYEKLIAEYAESDKLPLLKLRLGYAYHRLGNYDEAMKMYEEVAKTYYPRKEARIAGILAVTLKENDRLLEEASALLVESAELSDKDIAVKQELFYQLGVIYAKLFDFKEARKFFDRAVNLDPVSDIAVKSQFNAAWILKKEYRLVESFKEFSRIIEAEASSALVLDSRYQMADIYHSQGKYEEAIELHEKLAEEYKDRPIAALCLFQAGAFYSYDLNDTAKAEEVFSKLTTDYPTSVYAQYLSPEKSRIGMFLNYVVPRATNIITWRTLGLLCLSGYSGELFKADLVSEEPGLNVAINDWCKEEFPDTLGNIYFNLTGVEIDLTDDNIVASGVITFGRFSVNAEAELHLEINENGSLEVVVTKAYIEEFPILPLLINNALSKLALLINKYFPIVVTDVSLEEGRLFARGFGGKRILERIKGAAKNRLAANTEIEGIDSPREQREIYTLFEERFPASDFSPSPTYETEDLFLDFFTRLSFYASFKLVETVKDSKFDYQRSIRTMGQLAARKSKFRVSYSEDHVNTSANIFIYREFPWLINKRFLFDVIGIKMRFKDNEDIEFKGHLGLGYSEKFPAEPKGVELKGTAVLAIDEESKLPRLVFKEVSLDDKPFPVDKLNLVTSRCLEVLKDAHIPFEVEEIKVYDGGIAIKGKAPRDYSARVFSDPYLFVIFHVREWDLGMAGIERLREPISLGYEDYRGRLYEKGGYKFPKIYRRE